MRYVMKYKIIGFWELGVKKEIFGLFGKVLWMELRLSFFLFEG